MTHIVLGYPSLDDNYRTAEVMVRAGVDLMELQIPFSEPIADGPVILSANQAALQKGVTVRECTECAAVMARNLPIPFLFMSYYNIPLKYGIARFASMMAKAKIRGAIVPDLPHEEAGEYLKAMESLGLSPIFLFAPTTTERRMRDIAKKGRGFIYCVARKGVTGAETSFSDSIARYLARCRQATDLPLALGFGIKEKKDINYIKGKADIAVIGSQTIRLMNAGGINAVEDFIESLK